MKLPRRLEPLLFIFVLSGLMSLLVSGISTFRATGWVADFFRAWMGAWFTAWLFAFPIAVLVAPLARRAVQRLMAPA